MPLLIRPWPFLPGKRRLNRAFDTYVNLNLSFADAYHAVLMQQFKVGRIVSLDKGSDRVAGIERIIP